MQEEQSDLRFYRSKQPFVMGTVTHRMYVMTPMLLHRREEPDMNKNCHTGQ